MSSITRRDELVALSKRQVLPTIYPVREYVTDGGLISYGSNLGGAAHQAGIYAGRIALLPSKGGVMALQPDPYFDHTGTWVSGRSSGQRFGRMIMKHRPYASSANRSHGLLDF